MTISPHDIRLKRLKMRSNRRGMKEMDLILGGFAKDGLIGFSEAQLDLYEKLLTENDQELYLWFTGHHPAKAPYQEIVATIARHQGITP